MMPYNFVIHFCPLSCTVLEIITLTSPFSTRWSCKWFHPVAPRHHSYEDSCNHPVIKRVVRDFSGHPVCDQSFFPLMWRSFSNQTDDSDSDDEDAILADLKEKWKTLEGNGRITEDATLSDILEVDAELLTASYPTDEKILKSLMDNNKGPENDSYSENEDMIQPKPHSTEMLQSFETIKRGFQVEENVPDSIFSSLIKCENFYENLT
ncbi:hypothetical protein AVEN_184050-1 [Araneus ventricosus]|uniref:Uncharacterized protein n=1 Tax=Araneus ventricosus TaxID=182803 RepID=A0A4Y2UB35_ARAVE|nr:hypothetical protein AVEN_184050-1 [Araneus ventricosus]